MIGGLYHCIMVRSFDFILGIIYYCCFKYGRILNLHRNGIYAIYCQRAIVITMITITVG